MTTENGSTARRDAHPRHDHFLRDAQTDLPGAVGAMPPPKAAPAAARRFSVWRLFRLTAACLMTAAALWWLAVPFFFPVTGLAVVNARTVQVRAPIDGAAAEVGPDVGDRVEAGEPLLKVVSAQVDASHLAELAARRSGLRAQRQRLAGELAEAAQTREECLASTRRFYRELVASEKACLDEAEARVQTARVERQAAHVRTARLERLALQQAGSDSELDLAREGESVAAKRIEEEEAGRSKLEKELRAAEQGFLFQRDAPFFEQRADVLAGKIEELRGRVRETDDTLAAAEVEWRQERGHVDRLTEAALASPVSGTVWKRVGAPGQVVKRQDDLMEVADRDTVFVEALLAQTHLAAISPGCRAVVKLADGRVLGGRVRAVRTPGGGDDGAPFAVNLTSPDVKQVRVLIDLDPADRDAALVGRHARVFIAGERPGAVERAVMWLFGKLGV